MKYMIMKCMTNLENIMLRERSQSQRTACCMILFTRNVQKRQIYRERKQTGGRLPRTEDF